MKRRRGAVCTGYGSSRCLVWLRSTRKINLTDRVKIPGRNSAQNSFEQRSASVTWSMLYASMRLSYSNITDLGKLPCLEC